MQEKVSEQFPLDLQQRDACGVGFIFRRAPSHAVIEQGLEALARVEHRGACGSDGESGDGAGLLLPIPWDLFAAQGWVKPFGDTMGSGYRLRAVGMMYLPRAFYEPCREAVERFLREDGFRVAGWRHVPTDDRVLGPLARATCPDIAQVFVEAPEHWDTDEIEARFVATRKRLFHYVQKHPGREAFYIASLSCRTIVYKAMVKSSSLSQFYPDLQDSRFESNWAIFHRRFSTNTLPRWPLAQPFRLLAHNGEINTLLGNRRWFRAREPFIDHPMWSRCKQDGHSVLFAGGSDSANLDNALELLTRFGHPPESALMQLIPEAYRGNPDLVDHPDIVDFYEYYAGLQEPWDGPAAVVFSDGKSLGAVLDRNGLRPARYAVYSDGSVVLASEVGIVDLKDTEVIERGRLGPGQMISIDLESGRMRRNLQIKKKVASSRPYGDWLREKRIELQPNQFRTDCQLSHDRLISLQLSMGYGKEDVKNIIIPMALGGEEPIFSMGDDTPLAVLSEKPRVLYDYFKQRFAQVTNPPIDYLRERLVMGLDVYLGGRYSYLYPSAGGAQLVHLSSPLINEDDLQAIEALQADFASVTLQTTFNAADQMDKALNALCAEALQAVQSGKCILVLSDRQVNVNRPAIPILLAVGAVHEHLMRAGLRLNCSLVVETAQCWTSHHFACLLAYGAQAICPYLAFETLRDRFSRVHDGESEPAFASQPDGLTDATFAVLSAQKNFKRAIESGLRKILSKMGISLLTSYMGAQLFECLGLGPAVIERCFEGTPSRIGGMELPEIASEAMTFHKLGFFAFDQLIDHGRMKYRPDGEHHGHNPMLVRALHTAVGLRDATASEQERHGQYQAYSAMRRSCPPVHLRDLLTIESDRQPIDLNEVEPVSTIVRRFFTGGMSLGALSKEAHECLAIAMNRLGGSSNSGEGGEDPLRYRPVENINEDGTSLDYPNLRDLQPGDSASSAIRQVASGRFGVTAEYLATAQQLEIKMAQGAKPGEGGQLPGHKVSAYIARLRRTRPGTTLISPPPHHDIYSIEDLAQLIYDLKQVNPEAKTSVKLVSEVGVGTVAAGVAKANADVIQISGHDGGTGASPLLSIKHAGSPWELGLAEAHQTLTANELRDRVVLRVDGGLKSGRDIVMAALLGGDEFGFGTIALVAAGCIVCRNCHTNNCPTGIATQKEELRRRLSGSPRPIIKFFVSVAEEVRSILAGLGYRSISELVGRVDLLRLENGGLTSKTSRLDISWIMEEQADGKAQNRPDRVHGNGRTFDDQILEDDEVSQIIANHGSVKKTYIISNQDRSIGAKIAGRIARQHGENGFGGLLELELEGTAGQSFGAFNISNVNLVLKGQANDYVGKGMTGGEIVIYPAAAEEESQDSSGQWSNDNVLVGNTCLYGATGGKLFVSGQAGERFAVRNSEATAVVEGAGDHCCEYMTGGTVVILGKTGRNFGAGMTGGVAYVLDKDDSFAMRTNKDGVHIQRVATAGAGGLRQLITEHHARTGSPKAAEILSQWSEYLPRFWQVVPIAIVKHPEACIPLPATPKAAGDP